MLSREQATPLDFKENPPLNMWDATSRVLKHFGDNGATLDDLCQMFIQNCPQYKPESVSPALTWLIRVRCAKEERRHGTRRLFHLKSLTSVEMDEIREGQNRVRLESARKKLSAPAPEPAAVPKLQSGDTVVKAGHMLFAIGVNETVALTPKQAKELFQQLRQIFE